MFKKLTKNWLMTALLALVMGSTGAVAQTTINFQRATGVGLTADTIMINNIAVESVTTNPFDPTRPSIVTSRFNVPFRFVLATLSLVPTAVSVTDTCASLTVNVSNASTGTPLAGATVSVGGSTVSGVTSALGIATLTGLSSGSAQVTVAASGSASSTQTVTLSCTAPTSIGMAVSPSGGTGSLTPGQIRIVLTWGQNPSDLDSHLTGPLTSTTDFTATTGRFHLYYATRTATGGGSVAVLDVDDVSSFGPETVTISPPSGSTTLRPGLYRYSVRHYSGSSTIVASPASVNLIMGSETRQFPAPTPTGTISAGTVWTVFELGVSSAGAVTVYPVNTYATLSDSAVTATTTGYGDIERGVDFARLPAK